MADLNRLHSLATFPRIFMAVYRGWPRWARSRGGRIAHVDGNDAALSKMASPRFLKICSGLADRGVVSDSFPSPYPLSYELA